VTGRFPLLHSVCGISFKLTLSTSSFKRYLKCLFRVACMTHRQWNTLSFL